jgi:transposase InsO family protein
MPKRRRSFTPQFKAQVVLEVLSGLKSPSEVARHRKLKPELDVVYNRKRIHSSLGDLTPVEFEQQWLLGQNVMALQ